MLRKNLRNHILTLIDIGDVIADIYSWDHTYTETQS